MEAPLIHCGTELKFQRKGLPSFYGRICRMKPNECIWMGDNRNWESERWVVWSPHITIVEDAKNITLRELTEIALVGQGCFNLDDFSIKVGHRWVNLDTFCIKG